MAPGFSGVQARLLACRMPTVDCSPHNHSELNVDSPWELRFWSAHLRVDPDVLVEAVRSVGNYLGDVVNHLSRSDGDACHGDAWPEDATA